MWRWRAMALVVVTFSAYLIAILNTLRNGRFELALIGGAIGLAAHGGALYCLIQWRREDQKRR
jgi:hypothetical protein